MATLAELTATPKVEKMFNRTPFSLIPAQLIQSPSGYLWEEGEGGGAPSSTPAAATQAAPAAAPATPSATAQPATPATPQTPATGAPEGWVPSYRVRETREAAQREAQAQYSTERQQMQAELQRVQNQLRTLVGANPPGDPQVDAVRSQFSQLYPGLSELEQRAADILGMIERSGDWDAQTQHGWEVYGRQTMDKLFSHAAQDLGAPLTDEGKRSLHSAFVGFVQSSPEMQNRYANDPTLVDEYWKMFSSSFISPARRAASATVATRAGVALPQDNGGAAPPTAPGPKPANLDERSEQAWAMFQQLKK